MLAKRKKRDGGILLAADALPILEHARLDVLAGELNSWADAMDFAAKFLDLLPRRVRAVTTTVQAGEAEAAHVALVSLAASAGMVGALQLERDARLADEELRAGHLVQARESLPGLWVDARAVIEALRDLLRRA